MDHPRNQFLLNPDINYLNHGSFGACPKPIFEDYRKWQLMLERDPVQFVTKTGPEYLNQSKEALADFIHCDKDDFVYVTNPSTAGNIIIKGLELKKGDEILTTNHEYGAMDRTWNYICKKTGAKYVRQEISLPLLSKEQFLEAFWSGLTENTKVVFLSHISSSTALIFPVKEICKKARELGLITFIDGAHVPGQIPLNLTELDADIYTGACHKWLLTPKGCSFLYVRKELQDQFDPLIISWGYEAEFPSHSRFLDYHEYQGTRDFSAFLTVPAALKFREDFGWEEKIAESRKKIRNLYPQLCELMGSRPICKIDDAFLGQMCSVPTKTDAPIALKEYFFEQYAIEIPVFKMGEDIFTRLSIQPYTLEKELKALFDAIPKIREETDLIGNFN